MKAIGLSCFSVLYNKKIAADEKKRGDDKIKPVSEIKLGEVLRTR